jgi:hypothetical protein
LGHAPGKSATQFELLGYQLVTGEIRVVQIIQQPPALAHHHQQTPPRVVILLVILEMAREVVDALCEQSNLNIRRAGVLLMQLE